MLKPGKVFLILAISAWGVSASEHAPGSGPSTPRTAAEIEMRMHPPASVWREREERARQEACRRMLLPETTSFSFWGYRHSEAHCRNWVRQLQESTGTKCCNSPYSGECRVSRYDPAQHAVEIDGVWCPVTVETRWGAIQGIAQNLVLACAGRSGHDTEGFRRCPKVDCVGGSAGT